MTALNTRTTPQQKEQAFHAAMRSHPQLERSFNTPGAKWRRYFDACTATGWTMAPADMRADIQAWQRSTPSRDSAVQPMRALEQALY